MLKISTRLTLWYLLATAVIISCLAIAMYYIFESQRRDAIDKDLRDYADFLTSGLEGEGTDLSGVFDELLERKDKPPTKLKAHRFVLASNDSVISETNSIMNLDSILNELDDKEEFSFSSEFNTIKVNNIEYRTFSIPLDVPSGKDYQLIVINSLDKLYESLDQLRNVILIISPVSLFFAGFIGYIIAKRALAPVRDITATASAISSTSLDKRVPIGKTQDELWLLAVTFNDMINRLDLTFKAQQRFVADASHDIRTPLTIIKMELELLKQNSGLDNDTKEALERSLKEITSLTRLSDSLLILAKADANSLILEKKFFRFDEMVMDCLSRLNWLAREKNISFRISVDDPIMLNGDEELLKRVFSNIIENALKYSPENSTVSLQLENTLKNITVTVNNLGKPIPQELLVRIFDRFQRGDISRSTKGFGLGLAIAKAILLAHNGSITIRSAENLGTNVKIFLPV